MSDVEHIEMDDVAISILLEAYRDMGATEEEIREEAKKLRSSPAYLADQLDIIL